MCHIKPRIVLLLGFGWIVAASAQSISLEDHVEMHDHSHLVEYPLPEFPKSELVRGKEGWVLLRYTVLGDGTIFSPIIEASSGSEAFEEAALEAVAKWRYVPGDERSDRVLMNFVFERRHPYVSKKFVLRSLKLHQAIAKGQFDDARRRIEKIRDNDDLTAFELAYTYIAEGRLHGETGDKFGQLTAFRTAMINDGRWLDRDDYLKLLYAAVVLELQLDDYSTAIRDYQRLTETGAGRKLAKDLEEPMRTLEGMVAQGFELAPPYNAADYQVFIEREARGLPGGARMPRPEAERERPRQQRPEPPPRERKGG